MINRRKIGLCLAIFVALSAAGCRNDVSKTEQTAEAVSDSEEPTEQTTDSVSDPEESVLQSGSDMQKKEKPEEDNGKDSDELTIELPDGQNLVGTYDSVERLTVEPGTYVAVVAKDLSSGYWKAVKKGAEQAIEDVNENYGYTGDDKVTLTFEGPSSEQDVDAQINTIDSVITENPDVLCLGVIDSKSCQAQLELAAENGIPVIITDSGIDDETVISCVGIDNAAAGREAADHLATAIGEKGKVLLVAHEESAQTSLERVAGFTEELKNYPEIELVETLYENDESSVEDSLKAAFDADPDISGVFATNENMSIVVLSVLKELDPEGSVSMVGFDSGEDQIQAVENGEETGIISQNPYTQGYATVIAALRSAGGMETDSFINTGYAYLDKATIDLEENRKYLYK